MPREPESRLPSTEWSGCLMHGHKGRSATVLIPQITYSRSYTESSSLPSHCNSDRGHGVAFESCLGRKLFNYCGAKGKVAPHKHGECANLVFGGSSLWVAASQLRATLQINLQPRQWQRQDCGLHYCGGSVRVWEVPVMMGSWDRSQSFISINPRQFGTLITGRNPQQGGEGSGWQGGAAVNCQGPCGRVLVRFPALQWLTCSRLSINCPGRWL